MDKPSCRGQCYDGASNMSGEVLHLSFYQKNHVLYITCNGYALNLAVEYTIKQIKLLRDTLDTCLEMSKLLKYSPKCDAAFEVLKLQISPSNPGYRTLCPTRWTVRAATLNSIFRNFAILREFWEQA